MPLKIVFRANIHTYTKTVLHQIETVIFNFFHMFIKHTFLTLRPKLCESIIINGPVEPRVLDSRKHSRILEFSASG